MKETKPGYYDDTIVNIEADSDGKYIHYMGYGYYAGDPEDKPCRFVEYVWLYAPLAEALELGICEYEGEYQEFRKQYIEDVDENELVDIYEHYDNGKMPKIINVSDINMDTPCGTYIVDMGYGCP